VRVIDLYSVKPIDTATLVKATMETGHLVVVEDHWAEGGLGDAVLAALATDGGATMPPRFTHLAVREMPRSGKPDELLDHYGISAGTSPTRYAPPADRHKRLCHRMPGALRTERAPGILPRARRKTQAARCPCGA
jgi:transketolase